MKRLLDLYSGAGLAAIGYHQAGFEVVGVDILPQKNYPFLHIQADALDVLQDVGFLAQFDAIHASPPCQAWSNGAAHARSRGKQYPDLIAPTREALDRAGKPYIIENVPNSPVKPHLVLTGEMFGLNVIRPRHFELGGWFLMQPFAPKRTGSLSSGDYVSVFGKAGYRKRTGLPAGWKPKFAKATIRLTWLHAMGVPAEFHNFRDTEIALGIPPAYTKYIGDRLIAQLSTLNSQLK